MLDTVVIILLLYYLYTIRTYYHYTLREEDAAVDRQRQYGSCWQTTKSEARMFVPCVL